MSRRYGFMRLALALVLAGCALLGGARGALAQSAVAMPVKSGEEGHALHSPAARQLDPFISDLEERTFRFFWDTANPRNGLVPDRYPTPSFSNIAAVGFGLTAYPIGVERGYVSREEARERVLTTLRFFAHLPNERGFFYHFIDMQNGARANDSEVSTVDTAWLVAGALFCRSYFDSPDREEVEIRQLADEIYDRVDWTWAQVRPPAIVMGWTPEQGFLSHDWLGYNEAMLVYLLALGSPTHPISEDAWTLWTSTYDKFWGALYDYDQPYLGFPPLFGHQYTHVWVDFRGIRDAYMRAHGIDYFENSRRATYAQRRYAIANPKHWRAYGKNVWGMSASDGPGGHLSYFGEERRFLTYAARGVGEGPEHGRIVDDGTIAPTAAISSLPFAPEIVLPAALEMYHRFGSSIYDAYGFRDAFNASFQGAIGAQPVSTSNMQPPAPLPSSAAPPAAITPVVAKEPVGAEPVGATPVGTMPVSSTTAVSSTTPVAGTTPVGTTPAVATAVNMTGSPAHTSHQAQPGWVDPDYIGIDQGPILAMIENYRSELVWRIMRENPYLREGLQRAGFQGGWLAQPIQPPPTEQPTTTFADNP